MSVFGQSQKFVVQYLHPFLAKQFLSLCERNHIMLPPNQESHGHLEVHERAFWCRHSSKHCGPSGPEYSSIPRKNHRPAPSAGGPNYFSMLYLVAKGTKNAEGLLVAQIFQDVHLDDTENAGLVVHRNNPM